MKFSFFMMPLHVPGENPSLAFQRDIDLINYADYLGFDEFWIGEHHSGGWETMPAPEMALAKASATAKNIRLGTSVLSLPFHHPFHVAERMVFLDHLTRGRAILGIGQSNLPPDIKLFDIPPQDLRPMMTEAVDLIVRLLESPEPVNFEGRYYQVRDMALQLRSYQQPRMPLAIATTGSVSSIGLAAKHNMITLSLAGNPPPGGKPITEQWQVMELAAEEHGVKVTRDNWRIVTYVHLADTREQAWEDIRAGASRDFGYFVTIGGRGGYQEYPDQPPEEFTPESVARVRRWIIGTPEDAIEAIEKLVKDTSGFGGLMMSTHEWMSQQKINYSLELFARYVMPHFRGHTQDLRAAWTRTQADSAAGTLPPQGGGPPRESPSIDDHRSNLHVQR
ncbi:MAG: LLM class flavin-dependent oxidoreductase [Dehalococcoidia bacterium]